MSDQSTFLLEEPLVSHSASQESASDWMTRAATSPLNSWHWLEDLAPSGWSGRMSPGFIPVGPVSRKMQMKVINGKKQPTLQNSSISPGNAGFVEDGGLLTLNIAEWTGMIEPSLKDEGVASLSDILETGPVPDRYYLTAKACAGILRRAEKRGKEFPLQLARALQAVVDSEPTLISTED